MYPATVNRILQYVLPFLVEYTNQEHKKLSVQIYNDDKFAIVVGVIKGVPTVIIIVA